MAKKYNLIKGLWKTWENLDIKQNVEDMMKYFQDLEKYLEAVLKRGLTLRENADVKIETQLSIPANTPITIRFASPQTKTVEGVLVLQSSSEGSLTWDIAANGQDLVYIFHTSAVSTVEKIKLVIIYQ